MKTLLALALLAASSVAAQAKDRRECIRYVYEVTGDMAASKRVCDPKNRVTNPNEYGWSCDSGDGLSRVKGRGAKKQEDAFCD
jgi:hypothetical protein